MRIAGAERQMPFRYAPSKNFVFSFFFIILKAKSKRFCGLGKHDFLIVIFRHNCL